MDGQLTQFLGSLAAILVLAGVAWWLKLGPEGRLRSDDEARQAAQEAVDGFEPIYVALDRGGHGALLADRSGRVLLLRAHGTHIAGRILTPSARAQVIGGRLEIDTSEKRFGSARLDIADAPAWVRRIEAIE